MTSSAMIPFYYLIDLHNSQTNIDFPVNVFLFYYLIDLHYSQTNIDSPVNVFLFYYLIDLHYSQTANLVTLKFICFTTL